MLLLLEDSTPDREKAIALYRQLGNVNVDVYDYVIGQVLFSKDGMADLHTRLKTDILATFPRSSVKNFSNRCMSNQLLIMRHVVLAMFTRYKGNEMVGRSRKTLVS